MEKTKLAPIVYNNCLIFVQLFHGLLEIEQLVTSAVRFRRFNLAAPKGLRQRSDTALGV